MKQIIFDDKINNAVHGGIMLDNGDVICGCCGGLIPKDEQTEDAFELIEIYKDWVNLDEEITGGEVKNRKGKHESLYS